MKQDATDLGEDFAVAAESLRRSTVQVRGQGFGSGSGVIWQSNGLIITNAHVVRGPQATVKLTDGRDLEAIVTARDRQRDLAALQVKAVNLPAVKIGDSKGLRVGELVLAVGNPLGLVGVVTTGIIHAIGLRSTASQQWIQADVRLAPGNSGGPLANVQGHVIGINSMIVGGLALAVPSHTVEMFLSGQGRRPDLGVTIQPVLVPLESRRVVGLLVVEVVPGTAAEAADLLVGDVLIAANNQRFKGPRDLVSTLQEAGSSRLQLDLLRGGKHSVHYVTVGSKTAGQEAA